MADITQTVYTQGMLAGDWSGNYSTQLLGLSFSHNLDPTIPYPDYNYIGTGCYRGADWPWWIQGPKWWYPYFLVPIYACLLALWHGQAFRERKIIFVMISLGCLSFLGESAFNYHIAYEWAFISTIGNWVAEKYIPGTVGSVLGAAFVSLGGSVYAWWCNGYAFAAMVPGVLILVPVSIISIHLTTEY